MEFIFQILPLLVLLLFRVKNHLLLLLVLVVLTVIAGFRGTEVGTDTMNYYLYFYRVEHGIMESGYEPLWQLLNIGVYRFGGNFQHVTLVASVLTLIPLYLAFKKESRLPLFSLFIYIAFNYYFSSFNIMRQMLAVSWALLAFVYYRRERPDKGDTLRVALFTLIAFLFHYTAIVIIPIFWIIQLTLRYNKWVIIQIASLILGVLFGPFLFSLATRFLPFYSQYEARDDSAGAIINLALLNLAFLGINNIVRQKDKWFSLFFCFIVFSNVAIKIPFANRFVVYAGIALTVFMANLLSNSKLPRGYIPFLWLVIVAYSMYRFSRLFGGGDILPYINVLFS